MNIEKIQEIYGNVPVADLTEREKVLVQLLFPEDPFANLPNGVYRALQFGENLPEGLSLLLPELIILNEKLAVEKFTEHSLGRLELLAVLETLSLDMAQPILAYVGDFADKNELATQLFLEEQRVFAAGQSLADYSIAQGLKNLDSRLLTQLKNKLSQDIDSQKLVKALYENKENHQQAAKALFFHRNSLINKIKRYEEKYGLELRGSDLVLAYHLIS